MANTAGKLYLVPTPIGNLGDISERAIETLEAVDLIACEDTRHTGNLLKKLELKKKLISYHDFNERSRAAQLVACLEAGESVAVVTDAGSPGISDPAYRVVRFAIDHGFEIVPLPGPCAIIPAVTASGLPTDRFFFEGFLPNKGGKRRTRLSQLADIPHTIVFYESPHRTVKALTDMRDILGNRLACVAREISKVHEQFMRGTLDDILSQLTTRNVKGEIVIVVAGADYRGNEKSDDDRTD
ncbi:16S rRNA (cytidine(1402)-2'-O)-methyltransferase [candidate division GN15 bacterium]|nr:16S rRNA (cytidine(1402)-2'-O)-methyltransferase [candidate division GN15 bacterium]